MRYVCLLLFFCFSCADTSVIEQKILSQNEGMEAAWNRGDKRAVAQFYTDDGYLLSSRGIEAQGRTAVDAYWVDFAGTPIDWTLTNYLITEDWQDITSHERWAEVRDHIQLWDTQDIPLPAEPVYQFGRSDLVREQNGRKDTSVVEFVLVWQEVAGSYRIFLDSYY